MASQKIGAISLVIAQSVERAKVVISTLPPLYDTTALNTQQTTLDNKLNRQHSTTNSTVNTDNTRRAAQKKTHTAEHDQA